MKSYIDIGNDIHLLNIEHPLWIRTCQLAYTQIVMAAPSEVVSITGPSRVGKSRLTRVLRQMLNPPGVGIDAPGSLSIGVRASNCNTNGAFSTKVFARKAVAALNHPIVATDRGKPIRLLGRDETEGALWLALERGLPATGKRYVFIDEAHNIIRATGKNGPGAILDAWKCIAEDANVILVLTATYHLHDALQAAPHVMGRNSLIHFPRYQVSRDDITGFNQIIETFAVHLPLAPDLQNLSVHSEYLYSGSLGCIGLLERWFRKALAVAMANEGQLDMRALKQSRTCNSDLKMALKEINDGEKKLGLSDFAPVNRDACKKTILPGKLNQDIPLPQEDSHTDQDNKSHIGKPKAFTCKPVRRNAGERTPGELDV